MIDRMRANYPGVSSGAYNTISGIPSKPSCSTCTSAETAQKDAYQWNTANARLLPSGQGTVTRNGAQFIITIRWDNHRSGATGLGCSGNHAVDLTCLTMAVKL